MGEQSDSIIRLSIDKSNCFTMTKLQAYKNSTTPKFSLIEFIEPFQSGSSKANSRENYSNKDIL